MIDYHSHILPGIDDGPSTLDESVRMARLLSKAGFTSVYCTPHAVRHVHDASNAVVRQAVKDLAAALELQGITLRLLEGREYCIDRHFHEYLDDLMPLEGTRYLLIEIPPESSLGMAIEALNMVVSKGFTPMIAHPERCRMLTERKKAKVSKFHGLFTRNNLVGSMERATSYRHIDLLDWLVSIECAFQCNFTSLSGMYGQGLLRAANTFLDRGIYTHFGTDAHTAHDVDNSSVKSIISHLHASLVSNR
jgi:protein-tyrosine phosphatase